MDSPAAALQLQNVLYERKGPIAYVTINRPKVLNALNKQTIAELKEAFEDARDDSTLGGVILTGAGDKAFAAGADISELASKTAVEAEEDTRFGQAVTSLIENLGKPVAAAINGFALGGGCEMAMACTFRIASESAKFGQPEVKLGVMPGYGGTQRLPRLVGKGRAMQILLSGEIIGAQEAYRIVANAPLAVKFSLEAVNRGAETSLAEGLALEASLFALCVGTEDKKEGTSAFLAKRAPQFSGR